MQNGACLLIAITLLCAHGACGTVSKPKAEPPPTVGATVKLVDGPSISPAGTQPPVRPRNCGPFAKPWVVAGAPRITDVTAEDARIVTALMRHFATMPLMGIRGRDGLIEAYTGCCSNVPDDCSMLIVRFDKQPDGEWYVVNTSEAVP
jgi:hypothetical protein